MFGGSHLRRPLEGFCELTVFDARLLPEYAVSISLLSAAAFVAVPGVGFTWRMNLPVPCNKRAGSGNAAP